MLLARPLGGLQPKKGLEGWRNGAMHERRREQRNKYVSKRDNKTFIHDCILTEL